MSYPPGDAFNPDAIYANSQVYGPQVYPEREAWSRTWIFVMLCVTIMLGSGLTMYYDHKNPPIEGFGGSTRTETLQYRFLDCSDLQRMSARQQFSVSGDYLRYFRWREFRNSNTPSPASVEGFQKKMLEICASGDLHHLAGLHGAASLTYAHVR